MRTRNKKRHNLDLPFSREEFVVWLDTYYEDEFDELFARYLESDCDKNLAPSIDRLDDYKPYSLDNIRLTTWKENNKKGRSSEKNKKQCGEMAKKVWSKKVGQYTLAEELINVYSSTREAERILGFVDHSAIAKVCRGESNTHKGFIWKYLEESNK